MSAPILSHTSTAHAFCLSGLIAFYRDLADEMHAAATRDKGVESGELQHWLLKVDTLNNTLAASFDAFTEAMRAAGHSAPMADGSLVHREDA